MISIPLKIGNENYYTIERKIITNIKNQEIADCSLSPLLKIDLAKTNFSLNSSFCRNIDINQLIGIFNKAADIFKGKVLMGNKEILFDEYLDLVVETTGLPIRYVKEGQGVIYYYLNNIINILKAQSPDSSIEVYNKNFYMKGNKKIGWIKDGIDIGIISPSNNPTVHTVWMTALSMKSQIMIKPSLDDVFTPLRIIQALLDAGLPQEFVCFLPGDHSITHRILSTTSKGLLFGSKDIIQSYKKMFPKIKYYGPGSSKLFIDEDINKDFDRIVNHAIEGILSYGGKGCISLSAIVCTKDGRSYAESIAEKLSKINVYNPTNPKAMIPVVKDLNLCIAFNNFIKKMVDLGAENMSQKFTYNDINIASDKLNYLLPTVLYMEPSHPMFGLELPFPFVTITSSSKTMAKALLKGSLSVSILSNDKEFYKEVMLDESIQMIQQGFSRNVYDVDPEKPFEGFVSDYLYKVKTI